MTISSVNNSVSAMNTTVNNMYNPYGNLFNQPDYFDTMFPMQTSTVQPPAQTTSQTPQIENNNIGDSYTKEEDVLTEPDDIASALLQNYKLAKEIEESYQNNTIVTEPVVQQKTTESVPTQQTATPVTQQTNVVAQAPALDTINTTNDTYSMQDMIIATQIANQFASNIPIQPKVSNDVFATQINANYGLNNVNQIQNLNYAA